MNRIGALGFALILVVAAGIGAYYVVKSRTELRPLYEAKFLSVKIDGVSLPVKGSAPVEVMTGLPVVIDCERVSPPAEEGKAHFTFDVGGQKSEGDDCRLTHTFTAGPGSKVPVTVEFQVVPPGGGAAKVIDRFEGSVDVRAAGPFVDLHALETPDKRPLPTLTVPQHVIPYVAAAMKLEGKLEDYVALFFLVRPGQPDLYLRVALPTEGGEAAHAITAAVKSHRTWGPDLVGYAAWPEEPITIGNPEDVRQMFEVVAGIFRKSDVPQLMAQCCGGGNAQAGAVMAVDGLSPEAVRALAVQNTLSTPIRVVRASGAATASGVVLPETPSAPR